MIFDVIISYTDAYLLVVNCRFIIGYFCTCKNCCYHFAFVCTFFSAFSLCSFRRSPKRNDMIILCAIFCSIQKNGFLQSFAKVINNKARHFLFWIKRHNSYNLFCFLQEKKDGTLFLPFEVIFLQGRQNKLSSHYLE